MTSPQHWDASAPVVPGIDELHSFAANPRMRVTNPVPATAPGGLEAGGLRYTGPSMDPRIDPIAPKEDWQERRYSRVVNDQVGTTRTQGEVLESGSLMRARDPRNTTSPVARVTQLQSVQLYQFQRPFGNRLAKRFVADHASFAVPNLTQLPDSYGQQRGRRRWRPTQRVIPEPMETQITSLVDTPPNVGYSVLPTTATQQRNNGWW